MKRKDCFMAFWILAAAVLLTACASDAEVTAQASPEPPRVSSEASGYSSGGSQDLIIETEALTSEPGFIDWEAEGTPMQVIALKSADGSVRLAFNTCQSCKGSPWAWFEYLGNGKLQCQNCMQQFPIERVGMAGAAGCSPITILDFAEDERTVTIPKNVLAEAVPWFENWKRTEA